MRDTDFVDFVVAFSDAVATMINSRFNLAVSKSKCQGEGRLKMNQKNRLARAFTLVELLVVIGIIALLIAILIPVLNSVRERANRIKCTGNLRAMGQAMRLYAHDNKNQYPRVLFNDNGAPNYFTGDSDPDPFSENFNPRTGAYTTKNDVTAGMFLLVRSGKLKLEAFLCPSSSQELDRVLVDDVEISPRDRSNFSSKKPLSWSVSYAFASQYPPVRYWHERGEETFKHSPSAPAGNAIAADRNDGPDRYRSTSPDAPREDMKAMNSRNHRSEGQNVLFNDCSVQWCKTPFVGYARDNIYLRAAPPYSTIAAHKYDSLLGPMLPLSGATY